MTIIYKGDSPRVKVLRIFIHQLLDLGLHELVELVLHLVVLGEDTHELVVLGCDRKIDNLSTDDHDQDQVLKHVHQVVFHAAVVLRQTYLG